MPLPLVALYAVFVLLSIITLVRVALTPASVGLQLADRWRLACVYAAEMLTALLFLHIRLSMPWLFSGLLAQYWPLIVLALAFAGAAASEVLCRRGVWVLGKPLGQTGAFLPMLPLLGYWAASSRVDLGFILLGTGLLYSALAMLRRSFGFGLLAALAMNGGLWRAFYLTPGLALAEHPQLWFIPLALCVLAAAYLTRARLSPPQFSSLRALCLGAIYISSTADIFLNGVAQAPYLPLVLAGLSVAGALAGMWLRVRSMLYLGIGFLLLAIACVIYHASVNLHQTWIIWLTGIACGGVILTMFALFEKKRQQLEKLVAQLREWQR